MISLRSPHLVAACQPPASLCGRWGRVFQLFSSCFKLMSEPMKFFSGKMIKTIASRRAAIGGGYRRTASGSASRETRPPTEAAYLSSPSLGLNLLLLFG